MYIQHYLPMYAYLGNANKLEYFFNASIYQNSIVDSYPELPNFASSFSIAGFLVIANSIEQQSQISYEFRNSYKQTCKMFTCARVHLVYVLIFPQYIENVPVQEVLKNTRFHTSGTHTQTGLKHLASKLRRLRSNTFGARVVFEYKPEKFCMFGMRC